MRAVRRSLTMVLGLVVGVAGLVGFAASWLARPRLVTSSCAELEPVRDATWVSLQGCVLTWDDLLLESEDGDLETFANRRQGVARKLYPRAPKWVRAWSPLASARQAQRLPHVLLRLESPDLLGWVNRLEAVSERERDAMLENPTVLHRMTSPARVEGTLHKPRKDLIGPLGGRVSATVVELVPGPAPVWEGQWPWLGTFALGLSMLGLGRRRPRVDRYETFPDPLDVRDVEVKLGQLHGPEDEAPRP